ncbi:regulator [Mycobacterium sp. 852002-51971_SCH5477799-a]|nr:regulator [Mycobacterium sp. 852002-51971_SCH5477799-a]
MLGLHGSSIVSADTLLELLWGDDPPRTAAKALQTHISALRRTLDDGFVLTKGTGWVLNKSDTDASRYKLAIKTGRDAAAAGDSIQAVARFDEALTLWRGIPELPDTRRGVSEKTRWIEGHSALVEDRADALLATGRAAEIIGELEAAVSDAPIRERRWGQLMLALYRAGRQGEALAAYQRARSLLADELGVDPAPELRRLEAAIVAQDASLEVTVGQQLTTVTRAVTFLLTDIEGSTAAWEADAEAMAIALARHDELAEHIVTSRGGRLIKTRGEGDATFSVFDRPSAAAIAALELQDAIAQEPWALRDPMRIRIALHTGEVELRDGDYFGRAVNRAARLRSLAVGGQILCSGATAELVIDSLPDDVVFADLGMRQLKNLARPEHVFELRLQTTDDGPSEQTIDALVERPGLPAVLVGPGPFVGRTHELEGLASVWDTALAGGMHAVLIAGEPGVGKTRLAGEWSQRAYQQGAVVLYGRCDEDLGAPYQPFAEALRSLVPCIGATRLRELRGVEALLALAPGLSDVLPDLAAPTRADPDTERYALFDAVVALLDVASTSAPVVVVLDDLHWAAKPTLLLLRHLLRFGDHARVQIVGTYRSTDLDRSHPLAAMLADLHRGAESGTANRLQLSGLDEGDVTAYVTEAGYDDEELARALASVTGGNPFFLIEALRHVDESGGVWDPTTLPQGVRETVSRRLSRLSAETNKALAAAAVVGSRFAMDLVERVVEQDLVDAFDEACKAGIVIEEPGGRYRFNHAIVRRSLLAELASVRRMRLHQRIAATLETEPGADDELLAELAHHYFECAWAGNAAKAVEYCRRAADQAMARLGYEGAAELYDRALHALEELDDELPDRNEQAAELLVARCEALLAAGDVISAAGAVSQLQSATVDSARLAAWATCFEGELSMLIHPERLDEVEAALDAAAEKLAGLDDAAGEAKAHTVRATCLARLGRIGDCEIALDQALTAARRAREHRRVNAVLAGAPLAALWGPNPVPRAGGRCLDVVRLLRITTDSPAVEATSTRCQAVLEAFRGRGAAARRMIDSARRTVTDLGLRHALLEVEQFAGIVELVIDDPGAAELHLRKAYNGFRRMGLDADTAETAALLGRACLLLDRGAEAGELCAESERLAGHALKPSIAWRTLRAQLLSRANDHDEARRVAEAAVSLAERTDALVDHGDACLALATVLVTAGDVSEARPAVEQAVGLWERKGAAALVEKARLVLDDRMVPTALASPAPPDAPVAELDNACVQVGQRVIAAIHSEAWDVVQELYAPEAFVESRRKIVGFKQIDLPSADWVRQSRRAVEKDHLRFNQVVVAVRGERLALARLAISSADVSPGAPRDEILQLYGLDKDRRIALQMWFDVEDIDAAMIELDAIHARFEQEQPKPRRLENAASRADDRAIAHFASRSWDEMTARFVEDIHVDDRRRGFRQTSNDRATEVASIRAIAALGATSIIATPLALRGDRLCLSRLRFEGHDARPEATGADRLIVEALSIIEVDCDGLILARTHFDLDDFKAALTELEARYLAGEAAAYARTWSAITNAYAAISRHELPSTTPDWVNIDHRQARSFAPGEMIPYIHATWDVAPQSRIHIEAVHRLTSRGAVVTNAMNGSSRHGFDAEWREVFLLMIEGDSIDRCELFDDADLDVAIATFDELSRPVPRLENLATRIYERLWQHFEVRDWEAITALVAENELIDDRRRVVNGGLRHGRDAGIEEMRAAADIGFTIRVVDVRATRGDRLALACVRAAGRDPAAIQNDVLQIVQIDSDERIAGVIIFDLDDFEAAIADLDARYLAGEAAAHARTWSVIADVLPAHNRHEIAAATPDVVSLDRRRAASFAPGEGIDYIRAGWELDQTLNIYIETTHRVTDLGAVFTWAGYGTSHEGFDAEWRAVEIMMVDREMISRAELFDEADLDAALAKFDQLSLQAARLENAASQVYERFLSCFASRDWDMMAEILADDVCIDDRRRTANAGTRYGRDAEIQDSKAAAKVGFTNLAPAIIATRGERLIISRTQATGRDPEAIRIEVLHLVEIDNDGRIVALVVFELDDFEAALEELDRRYLAGEAATHAGTWSVIAGAYAAINRHELPATTPDWVEIDRRRLVTIEPGGMKPYLRATWEATQRASTHIVAVHRLDDLGAVVTHESQATSQEGVDAEWQDINLLTVDKDLINHCELFDETDIDAALARFEELHPQAHRLKNAASRVADRFSAYYAAGDWQDMAEVLADNYSSDDRRRVVGSGVRHGRDAHLEDMRARTELWLTNRTSTVIATRGESLALVRLGLSSRDQGPEAFVTEILIVNEINADERLVAGVAFDLDDFDSAIEELDARYLAGEAAAHAPTWSVMARTCAAFNQHELPAATPNSVYVDHRPVLTIEAADLPTYLRGVWNQTPDSRIYIEAVHRLSNYGAVVTHAVKGLSPEGFNAEWRMIDILTVEGNRLSRCEVFEEAGLQGALARFDQLSPPESRLKNAASQAYERIYAWFATRDWDAMAANVADNFASEDRRRVVNAGVRHGRDAGIEDVRAIAQVGFTLTMLGVVATRGGRLALVRVRAAGPDPGTIQNDALNMVEIDADERIVASVSFDLDNFDAAIAELDARYLAGEAAAHAHTWSVIAGIYAAFNRRELPGADWVTVDHRRGTPFASSTMLASIRAIWDLTPDLSIHVEAVHQLNKLGAVITHAQHGTSSEGFDAEWRQIQILTVEGDRIDRCEIFDEADLDAALARFEELHSHQPRLQNAASQVIERVFTHFAARDWIALGELVAEDICSEDRRSVVNAGIRHGRDAEIADMRAIADVGVKYIAVTTVATRAKLLTLCRVLLPVEDQDPESFRNEALCLVELNADNRVAARLLFDPDDIDATFEELETRYVTGEAAPYAQSWSVIARECAAFNRHELAVTDWVQVDHRQLPVIDASDPQARLRAIWDITPDLAVRIEKVYRLSTFGAVATYAAHGNSSDGFQAEWRMLFVVIVESDRINRIEVFDEADLDAALARFDELQPHPRQLENAASQVEQRFLASFSARDWDAIAKLFTEDILLDDRRRLVNAGVRHGRDAEIANMRAVADVGVTNMTSTVIAIRGERLVLGRYFIEDSWSGSIALCVSEINAENRLVARTVFDADDFDAAVAELDTRYIASEAGTLAEIWSLVARITAGVNRQEVPATTPDSVYIDHRQLVSIEGVDLAASLHALWDITSAFGVYVEAIHRLDELGAVVTQAVNATMQGGLDAELRFIEMVTFEGDLLSRVEVFDEADLDAAIARFDELHPQAPRLENTAARVNERFYDCFTLGDWAAIADIFADDVFYNDRRRVISGGSWRGRDLVIRNMRAISDFRVETLGFIALRGERLALSRWRWSTSDPAPEMFHTEVLFLVEIDSEKLITGLFVFDPEDADAAFEELEARYLAVEAAAHAHTWTAMTQVQAAYNRHEFLPTTEDWVKIDHRRGRAFAPGDMIAYTRATYEVAPDVKGHIEAVHRLSSHGAVITEVVNGTSRDGFEFELREVALFAFDGDTVCRFEMFDEADLDAALARFDELRPQAPRLENAASQVIECFERCYAARNWEAMAETMIDDVLDDDRRRVTNAGVRRGRDAAIANMQAVSDIGAERISSTVIATRGKRLVLRLVRPSNDVRPEAFQFHDVLQVVEIDDNKRISVVVTFDLDDLDAAFEELDSRYVAGEAAAHAHTWMVTSGAYAVFNRHESPAMTPDSVYIDHRRHVRSEAVDLAASLGALLELTTDIKLLIEAVHRLSEHGAVVTHALRGTSHDGFDAESRDVCILTFKAGLISRCESFDEADIDSALARFDELDRPVPPLENASTRTCARLVDAHNRRDMSGFLALMAEDARLDERRKGLRGIHVGLALWKDVQRLFQAPSNWRSSMEVIALRGSRLSLTRHRVRDINESDQPVIWDALSVMEIGEDNLMQETISFDPDHIDAAFQQLDARYLAGEAAVQSRTWSLVMQANAAWNRHELFPNTADWVNIDHRRARAHASGELVPYLLTTWNVVPDAKLRNETVHRLTNLGAVTTVVVTGTSKDGFEAEWREICLLTFDRDLLSSCELFDETDLEAALARFDELDRLPLTQT